MDTTTADAPRQAHSDDPVDRVRSLTARQRAVYFFLRDFVTEHGRAPTWREAARDARLRRDVKMSSWVHGQYYATSLVKAGLLRRADRSRAMSLENVELV